MSIGCNKKLGSLSKHEIENCICWDLKNFEFYEATADIDPDKKNYNKIIGTQDLEEIAQINFSFDNKWQSLFLNDQKKKKPNNEKPLLKKELSFIKRNLNMLIGNKPKSIENCLVESLKVKEVTFLEKNVFPDFFLMFGNVGIFLYFLDIMATNSDFFPTEKRFIKFLIFLYINLYYLLVTSL